MADPSDKNNQPQREGTDEDEKPKKSSKSGEPERPKLVAVRRLQQLQRRRRRLQSRPPPPPSLGEVAARALQVARQFLQQRGRAMLARPLGHRLFFLADKALSCATQALRWAVPHRLTQQHEEHVVLPPSPLGLGIGRRVKSILWSIGVVVRIARDFLDLQRPRYRQVVDRIFRYRRELEGLKPARPLSVKSVQGSTVPRTQSTGQFQSFALWPTSIQAADPALTEAAGPSSAAVQRISVTPAPSESSSSSSSSASTGSITEEVVERYYSPPRFIQGWTKREETGDENGEKLEQDDELEDSEAQESGEQSASVAEEAAVVFAQAPIPPPAGQGVGEPGAEAGAAGAQGRRRPARVPKPFFFGLLGSKMA